MSPELIHAPKNEEYLEGLINKWRGLYQRVPTLNNRNRKSALKQALAVLIKIRFIFYWFFYLSSKSQWLQQSSTVRHPEHIQKSSV